MAAPAWTAREWRPLVRDLCAHVLDTQRPVSEDAPGDDRRRQQRLLLRADKLVAKLYAHKYMETTPQQIHGEVEEIATKMEIHMLDERAARLRQLASGCDYRLVKLLMELAEAPTRASDAHVAVEPAAPLEALQAWNRLLTPSKDVQRAEAKARQDAALAAKMEAELLQVAWEDDWWKERADDDASEFDDALGSDGEDEIMSEPDDDGDTVRGIASRVFESGEFERDTDSVMREAATKTDDGEASTDEMDGSDDEEDQLLLKYFRRAADPVDAMETDDLSDGHAQPQPSQSTEPAFSFEVPSMILGLVESVNEKRRANGTSVSYQPREPRRVVYERVLVEAVFYALRGVPSPFFETRLAAQDFFNGDCRVREFATSTLAQRGVGVSHLSPMVMVGVLERVSSAASNLQFLRDVALFLASCSSDESRSATAEGVASEMKQLLRQIDRFVNDTHECMIKTTMKGAETDEFSTLTVLPTLLSSLGSLQELFSLVSWLKSIFKTFMAHFEAHSRLDVSAAELSSHLLSALYHELQVEFIESSSSFSTAARRQWDSYEILCRLFAGALAPYLDMMDRMLFERGYDARVQLRPELFFVLPDKSASTPLSPRSSAQKLLEESFENSMEALMPFRVQATAVPTFLAPLVPLLSAALESRQILNQYLNHHTAHQHASKSTCPRLSDIFASKFDKLTKMTTATTTSASSNSTPFEEIVRQAVIQPITEKCVSINGTIADLFRDKLQFREHMETLRLFLLMHQQDVFTNLVQFLIEQIQLDPIGWAKNESLNATFQESIHRLHMEGLISEDQREIAARISIRVDTKELEKLRITRHIDVMAVRHLHFRFSTPQPLRVLFSGSIVHKYSRLAILLLQVKLVELILTNFKQTFRHRMCFLQMQEPLRSQLVRLSDMLHYTRAVLNYLANQTTGDAWSKVERVIRLSKSVREINDAHEEYLDRMLNSFFVLKKHEGFTRQFMQNFNDIIAYGSRVEDFVRTVERSMPRYFDTVERTEDQTKNSGRNNTRRDIGMRRHNLVPNGEFHALYAKLQRSLKNPEGNYENQLHVITIVLDAMVKNGASPHVNELLLLLTFNNFRSPSRSRLSSSR